MKRNTTFTIMALAFVLAALGFQKATARIWRINYQSNYNFAGSVWGDNFGGNALNPVFNSIESAQANSNLVINSDTLYLEGCPAGLNYASVTLTRPFVIIGTGYFLTLNANTSNDFNESRLNSIYFNAGSSGSQIIGVIISSQYGIQVNVNNITIKRCYFPYFASISIAANIQTINIKQNFFDNTTVTGSAIIFSQYGGVTGLVIRNNIFKRTLLVKNGSTIYNADACCNNIFDCPPISGNPSVQMLTGNFKNNIIKTPAITLGINNNLSSASVAFNTLATPTQLDTNSVYNNKYVSNMSNLFVTPTASTDGNYRLKSNAGSNVAGSDGAARGAFGGASVTGRYALSGTAAIPIVYDITTTGVATQATGLPVTIRARTIK